MICWCLSGSGMTGVTESPFICSTRAGGCQTQKIPTGEAKGGWARPIRRRASRRMKAGSLRWGFLLVVLLLLTACAKTQVEVVAPPRPVYSVGYEEAGKAVWEAHPSQERRAGCGARYHKSPMNTSPPTPPPRRVYSVGYEEAGKAVWEAHPSQERRPGRGEVYDMSQMTASHRTLPLGSRLVVESLLNRRIVEVRITGREFSPDRGILNLSPAAAPALHAPP